MLPEQGANINAECVMYGSALAAAMASGHENVAHLVLERGVDPNAPRRRALRDASEFGHEAVMRFLLQNKADPRLVLGDGGRDFS